MRISKKMWNQAISSIENDPESCKRHFTNVKERAEKQLTLSDDESWVECCKRDIERANKKLEALARGEKVSLWNDK